MRSPRHFPSNAICVWGVRIRVRAVDACVWPNCLFVCPSVRAYARGHALARGQYFCWMCAYPRICLRSCACVCQSHLFYVCARVRASVGAAQIPLIVHEPDVTSTLFQHLFRRLPPARAVRWCFWAVFQEVS